MTKRLLWRVTKSDRARTAFTGKGAARHPGRWNERGVPVVYTAESLAGAVLELLAHAPEVPFSESWVYFRVEVLEEAVLELDPKALPPNWNAFPHPTSTQRIGASWQRKRASVGLRVPSALIPETYNVLLNPEHPDFERAVRVEGPFPVKIDPRLKELGKPPPVD